MSTNFQAILSKDESQGHKGVRIALSVVEEYLDHLCNAPDVQELMGRSPGCFDVERSFWHYESRERTRDVVPSVQSAKK